MTSARIGILILFLSLSLLCGCARSGAQADPLLAMKKPVEGSFATGSSSQTSYPDAPERPDGPWTVVLKTRPKLNDAIKSRELPTLVWSSDKRTHWNNSTSGNLLDRDEDYGWLQGRIERPTEVRVRMRYATRARMDSWGRKVFLEPQDKVDNSRTGDVVYVEGKLLIEDGRLAFGKWSPYPRYQIRELLLVQRVD